MATSPESINTNMTDKELSQYFGTVLAEEIRSLDEAAKYTVHDEDGYIKVRHPEHGTVAAGKLVKTNGYGHGGTHDVKNIEMTEPKFNHNAIRQPAMKAMIDFMNKNYGKRVKTASK